MEPGWSKCSNELFPTFTTSCPRQTPGRRPAGIRQCTPKELERWYEDYHRFPPYQYRFCVRNEKGSIRLPSIGEREVLICFPRGYTSQCYPKGQRQGQAWVDERLSLVGNSWCIFVIIAWLIYCLGVARGLSERCSLDEFMKRCRTPGWQ